MKSDKACKCKKRKRKGEKKHNARINEKKREKVHTSIKRTKVYLYQEKMT